MKFSIICPIYICKEEGLGVVRGCLDSVKKYSKDYELIICDDGSLLETKEFENYADIFIRSKVNTGIVTQWNNGLRVARGRYICIINDDVEVCENWLEEMKKTMDLLDGDICGPSVEHLPNDPSQPAYQWFPGSCFMLKKQTIERVGLFDESFAPFFFEDTDYWTRVLKAGLKMVRVYQVFIKHKEGFTVKNLARDGQYQRNYKKFMDKHGFDPIPVFCGGEELK